MGIWLFLALLAVPADHEAPTGPPTFDQLQLAAQDPEPPTPRLVRWLVLGSPETGTTPLAYGI
ncbi:MAG: hypothetical protein MPN21_25825 [Thermoanaerobaculia bacterium]|nr:hypothetical protein [Thermoanaerobaculia bacterium]